MDYLFFDIECCDGRNICEFGYVVADENLKPINKDIILINPDARFNLGVEQGAQAFLSVQALLRQRNVRQTLLRDKAAFR